MLVFAYWLEALFKLNGLNPCSVSCGIPYCKPDPFLTCRVEGNIEGLVAERTTFGEINDLPVRLGPIAPDQLGKLQRKGIFDGCVIGALGSRAFDAPVVEENFAGGAEEVSGPYAFDNWRPAFVVERHTVQLEIVHSQLRIGLIVGTLGVSVAFRDHVLRLGSPVAHVVVRPKAADFTEPLLGQVQRQRLPRGADEAVAEEEVLVLVGLR